jgi:hypothetical protein
VKTSSRPGYANLTGPDHDRRKPTTAIDHAGHNE